MTQLTFTQAREVEKMVSDWNRLCRLGGIVSWIQLGLLLLCMGIGLAVGFLPVTAAEYFETLNNDGFVGILRLDLANLILLALFLFVAVAICAAFRQTRPAYGLLAMVLILTGTLLGLANESAFAMMYLGDLYAAALLSIGGVFYLFRFVLLGGDLVRLGRR
jgi:uncharacterized membrane protein